MNSIYFEKLNIVSDNCYLITKGVRSAYTDTITGPLEDYEIGTDDNRKMVYSCNSKLREIKKLVESYNLYFYAYKPEINPIEDVEGVVIWIYKYKHQLNIIKNIIGLDDDSWLKAWIIGKLLGYSDESMEDFLSKIHK